MHPIIPWFSWWSSNFFWAKLWVLSIHQPTKRQGGGLWSWLVLAEIRLGSRGNLGGWSAFLHLPKEKGMIYDWLVVSTFFLIFRSFFPPTRWIYISYDILWYLRFAVCFFFFLLNTSNEIDEISIRFWSVLGSSDSESPYLDPSFG